MMSVSTECLVMFNYKAKLEDELNLRVGDIVTNVIRKEGGWWSGTLGDEEGVFPENYVKVLQGPDAESGLKFLVSHPYNPVREDELALEAGQVVVKVGEVEKGWWRGRVGNKVGVFPFSFVRGPISDLDRLPAKPHSCKDAPPVTLARSCHRPDIVSSPVVFRRNSSRMRSIHASLDQNMSVPISANLFDPEDEPLGPMFGSLSSQLEKDWSTASLSSCSNSKPGLFARIRHSFGGKSILPRFLSGRLSSGSLFETRSSCSPMMTRRNSFAAFFKRSPSAASSRQDLKETSKLNRNSRSWDAAVGAVGLPGLKPLESTPVLKLEGDFRKVSLSSDIKRSGRDPEQSLSWVWQEVGSKTSEWMTPTTSRRPFISSGDSGVDGCEPKYDEPEELFGPVDITDEVFEDMFNNSKYSPKVPIAPVFDFSEALEEKLTSENKVMPSKIRTSFTSIDPSSLEKALKRNLTSTNPFVSWKPSTDVQNLDKVQVTEI